MTMGILDGDHPVILIRATDAGVLFDMGAQPLGEFRSNVDLAPDD